VGDLIGSVDWSAVVQAVGGALVAAFGAISGWLQGIAGHISQALFTAFNEVAGLIGSVNWGAVVQAVGDALGAAFGAIGGWIASVAQDIAAALGDAFAQVSGLIPAVNWGDLVQAVGDSIGAAFGGVGGWFQDVASTIGSALGSVLSTVGNFLGALDFSGLVSTVTDAITGAFGGGGNANGGGSFRGGEGAFGSIAANIGSALTSALGRIGDFVGAINFGTLATDVVTAIQNLFSGETLDLSAFGENIKSALEEACGVDLTSVFTALESAVTNLGTAFSNFRNMAGPALSTVMSYLQNEVWGTISSVFDTFRTAVQNVAIALGNLRTAGGPALSDLISKLGDAALSGAAAIVDGVSAAFNKLAGAFALLSVDLPSLTTISDTIANFSVPEALSGLGDIIKTIGEAAVTAAVGVKDFFAALGGEIVAGAGDTKDRIATLGPQIDGAVNGLVESVFGTSDQAVAAAAQQGDFATNFIGAVASSFAGADWSPVTNAINAGLASVLGGAYSGAGGPRDAGPSADGGIGTQLATSLVTSLAGAITPESFAPVKAAFDAALNSVFTGAEGASAEGGGMQAVAQQIIADIAGGLGQQTEVLTSALQAVISAAGAAISGLESVGEEIISQISGGLGPATGTLTSALQAVVSAVHAAATAAVAVFVSVGTAIVTQTAAGIGPATGTLISAVQAMVQAAIDAGVAAAAAATTVGEALVTNAGTGVGSATGTFVSAVQAMVATAIDGGVAAAADAARIGAAVSEGAASGVMLDAMNSAVAQMVENGIAAGMAAAEAASPSKKAERDLGQPIAEGAAEGVDRNADGFISAIEQMVSDGLNATETGFDLASKEASYMVGELTQAIDRFGAGRTPAELETISRNLQRMAETGRLTADDLSFAARELERFGAGRTPAEISEVATALNDMATAAEDSAEPLADVCDTMPADCLTDTAAAAETLDLTSKEAVYQVEQLVGQLKAFGGDQTPAEIVDIALSLEEMAAAGTLTAKELQYAADELKSFGGATTPQEIVDVALGLEELAKAATETTEEVDGFSGVIDKETRELIGPLNDVETALLDIASEAGPEFVQELANTLATGSDLILTDTGMIVDQWGQELGEDFTMTMTTVGEGASYWGKEVAYRLEQGLAEGTPGVEAAEANLLDGLASSSTVALDAAAGITDATPVYTDSIQSMVDQGMATAESALDAARNLFAQHGMEFGNDFSANLGEGIGQGQESVISGVRSLYDKIRSEIEANMQDILGQDYSHVNHDLETKRGEGYSYSKETTIVVESVLEMDGQVFADSVNEIVLEPTLSAARNYGTRLRRQI
jgi:hypothetical protein